MQKVHSEITGIIPFTYFRGNNKPVGSSFLRVDALVKNNPDFEKWQHSKKYSSLIFQKAYWIEMMELFQGPMILDLCDPDWIKNDIDIIKAGQRVHAITCSSERLVSLLKGYFPSKIIEHVPDRLDLNFYPAARSEHIGRANRLIWFGFIHNAHETLGKLAAVIAKHNLHLVIVADQPYSKNDDILAMEPEFHIYDHSSAYNLIKTGDIVLNPKSDLSFFKYKSNNKSIISWNLGVPVAETAHDLELLIDPIERNNQVRIMKDYIGKNYDINQSAKQYREIFQMIKKTLFGYEG